MAPTAEATRAGYSTLWNRAKVRPERHANLLSIVTKIEAHKARYVGVEAKTRVPWFMIAAIHVRESSMDFRGVLHNGQAIVGTGKKTTIVPKGRGPFATWEAAAIDALTLTPHKLDKVPVWSVERILYEIERYNGWGYLGKTNSPYVWSWTTEYNKGKYVRDHVFDPNVSDTQPGCAAILKMLATRDAMIDLALNERETKPPKDVEDNETKTARNVRTAGGVIAGGGAASEGAVQTATIKPDVIPALSPINYGLIGVGVVAFVVFAFVMWKQKEKLLERWS